MVKKVLPPLNDQNQVPNIAGSGEWKAEDIFRKIKRFKNER